MNVRKATLALALLGSLALASAAQASPTPAPALKALAISAPTNLPPKQSEVQRLIVEAQGGTFKLALASQETSELDFNASAAEVQGALEALTGIGAGNVTVSGGPGGDAAHPYFIAFGGEKANVDIAQLAVSTAELTGDHPFAHMNTTVPGGAGTGTLIVLPANIGGATTSVSEATEVHLGPLPAGVVTSGPATGTEWECPGSAAGQSTRHLQDDQIDRPPGRLPLPDRHPGRSQLRDPARRRGPGEDRRRRRQPQRHLHAADSRLHRTGPRRPGGDLGRRL